MDEDSRRNPFKDLHSSTTQQSAPATPPKPPPAAAPEAPPQTPITAPPEKRPSQPRPSASQKPSLDVAPSRRAHRKKTTFMLRTAILDAIDARYTEPRADDSFYRSRNEILVELLILARTTVGARIPEAEPVREHTLPFNAAVPNDLMHWLERFSRQRCKNGLLFSGVSAAVDWMLGELLFQFVK